MVPLVVVRNAAKNEQEDPLEEQGQEVRPKTTAEAETREHRVARDAPETAREEVHQAEAPRQQRSLPGWNLEVHAEVRGELVVHRKLSPEARAVLSNHDHDPGILQAVEVIHEARLLRSLVGRN